MTASSPSSAETLAGFTIQRRLGEDLWEAVQPELGRRVALRRLPTGVGFDASRWPDGPGVVSLFAVVQAPDGVYIATRFLPGARTLSEVRRPRRRWFDQAAQALDGTVHGRLTARDVLIDADGRAWVTGFGLAPPEATSGGDREALEALRPPDRGRHVALPIAAVAAVTAGAIALFAGGEAAAPRVSSGATPVGSVLAGGDVSTVDCEGRRPSGESLPCTVMLLTLPGRPVTMPFDGLVTGWAVRGASGPISLQIIRPTTGGRYATYNQTRPVVADPDSPRVFAADRSAPKGSRFAVEVYPGSAVGLRPDVPGAATARFFSPLRSEERLPDLRGGKGQELLLRVDVIRLPEG